jgi:hypothetical protein
MRTYHRQNLTVSTQHLRLRAALAPDDPDLSRYVAEWTAFQQWHEQKEVVIGHPTTRSPESTCDGTAFTSR